MNKLRVFETFAGIGAQTKALTNIGANFEVVATSEWFVDAIIGYNAIHHNNIKKYKRLDALDFLKQFTISSNSKIPAKTIERFSDDKLNNLVSSIKNANNLGSIMDIKGSDVPEHDLLTYSFPCQDLSIAGKGKGFDKDSGTRSSLMWEVFRIVKEMKAAGKEQPSFLVMENVPAIQQSKFKDGFDNFKKELGNLGYKEHIEIVLDASKLGIPQRRKRFFMISVSENAHVRGGGGLNAALRSLQTKELPLKYKLKDVVSKDARYTNREARYVAELERRDADLTKTYTKLGVYPTFAQANIVTGINRDSIGTVTFSGENSRQRFAIKENGKIRVKEMGGIENFQLMGFTKADYKKVIAKGISDRKASGLAGNSIVVQQLEEIFKCILEVFE